MKSFNPSAPHSSYKSKLRKQHSNGTASYCATRCWHSSHGTGWTLTVSKHYFFKHLRDTKLCTRWTHISVHCRLVPTSRKQMFPQSLLSSRAGNQPMNTKAMPGYNVTIKDYLTSYYVPRHPFSVRLYDLKLWWKLTSSIDQYKKQNCAPHIYPSRRASK